MATFTWYGYYGTGGGRSWTDLATDTLCFSGLATDIDEPITVATWQDGTHVGDGDPGTDQCTGADHNNNVKFISSTEFDLNGGGTETLNDTNLLATECTIRIDFTDASSVVVTSARFYSYDGTTETTEAVGVEVYAYEQGVGEGGGWTFINDDSTNYGGDNSGERLDLSDQATATEHTFYVALSASPESVGAKTSFDFGIALTYS
ncbi:MAG: hypothetical protein ACYSYL_00235 [Planctomycetota bacterium]|jgi:hypothetical protein